MTTTCSYCSQPATTTIIANPGRVCLDHAIEFWTGLLEYTHSRSGPCVKEHEICTCPLCEEIAETRLRASAIANHRPSPADHEEFTIRLAS